MKDIGQIIKMYCTHKNKKFLKQGNLNGSFYEFIICDICRNDSDLQNFSEIPIVSNNISQNSKDESN